MNANIDQLSVFLAVAETGSFTRAAERLRRAQSGVSLSVRELEAALGVRLFERTTRRVELSDPGRDFLPEAQRMVAEFDRVLAGVRDAAASRRGRLGLAVPPFMVATWLPPLLARFQKAHPAVTIALHDVATGDIAALLSSGAADIGIGVFASAAMPASEFVLHPLWSEPLLAALPADHPLARRRALTWADLAALSVIGQRRDLAAESVPVALRHEVVNVSSVFALVEAGLGIGLVPRHADTFAAGRPVMLRPLRAPVVTRGISAMVRRGRTLSPPAAAFLEQLRVYGARKARQSAAAD